MRVNDRTYLNLMVLSMALVLLQTARCDLPIHCLKHQIPGKWVIQTTQGYKDRSKYVRCGHSSPDNQESFANRVQLNLKVKDKITLQLLENGDVETTLEGDSLTGFRQTGNWTMMYDEGIIIKLGGTDYFGFFKYTQLSANSPQDQQNTTQKYEYDCTQTSTGWFSSSQGNVKGCMMAIKLDGKEEDRHLKSIDKGLEVQPTENQVNNFNELSLKEEEDQQKEESLMTDQRQSQFSSLKKAKVRETEIKTRSQMLLDKALDKILSQKTAENRVSHDIKVEYLNGLEKKWIAGISESFKNLSREEVNKKSGRERRKKSHKQGNQSDQQDKNIQDMGKYLHYSIQDVSDLPKEFTWKDYIEQPMSQNDCGSCYVISTISMLNARLKIKMGKEFSERISMQHILNCSFYSQGCEGGYPYEVGRFGQEYFLIQEKLAPLTGSTEKCQNMKKEDLEGYFKVTNYGFVGGAYGRCNEREMMIEIMNNGPIVANLKIDDMFLYYSSGVFHSVEAADWIIINEKEPEWRPVEHAVLCYGWGESEEEGKYWLMQNSWGSDWGTEGRFKIRRGTDESFVESSAEFANVEFFKNS